MSERWLVTGSAGFVGRLLVESLAAEGKPVAGFELGDERGGNGDEAAEPSSRLLTFAGDLCDLESLRRAVCEFEPDVVVHLGGLSSVGGSWRAMADYFRVNVLGTRNLLAACASRARVVLASSGEIYGISPRGARPSRENDMSSPVSPYGLTKAAAELLVLREGGVVVRCFSLVGPGQGAQFAMPSFASALARMSPELNDVLEVGNLDAERDFLHVLDGVDGYRAAAERGEDGGIYNLCRGETATVRELLDQLVEISGRRVEVRVVEDRLRRADIPCLCGDPSRLRALGWSAARSLREALEDLWREQSAG